jgi:hypothetical protein
MNARVKAAVEIVAFLFFSTDVFRELVVRAMIFHKEYCSVLVYIVEPLVRVTEGSHILLLSHIPHRQAYLGEPEAQT